MITILFGITYLGALSDTFGRKKLVLGCGLIHFLANLTTWLCPDVVTLVLARMVSGKDGNRIFLFELNPTNLSKSKIQVNGILEVKEFGVK